MCLYVTRTNVWSLSQLRFSWQDLQPRRHHAQTNYVRTPPHYSVLCFESFVAIFWRINQRCHMSQPLSQVPFSKSALVRFEVRHQCAHNASAFLCCDTWHRCYFVGLLQKCPDIIRSHGAFTFQISNEPKSSLRHFQKISQNPKDRIVRKLWEAKGTFEGKVNLSEFLIIIIIFLFISETGGRTSFIT